MTQKTKQIDDAMAAAQTTQLEQLANEQSIVIRDFDAVLQPIIESCTKDSISSGKYTQLQLRVAKKKTSFLNLNKYICVYVS